MSANTIMVQYASTPEGHDVFRRACQMARARNLSVTLVCMQPIQHFSWLGDGECPIDTPALRQACDDYAAIADEYGVALEVMPFQYYSLAGAIADAADLVDAQMVYASLPQSPLPFVGELRARSLRRRLAGQGRALALAGERRIGEAAAD